MWAWLAWGLGAVAWAAKSLEEHVNLESVSIRQCHSGNPVLRIEPQVFNRPDSPGSAVCIIIGLHPSRLPISLSPEIVSITILYHRSLYHQRREH